MNNTSNSSTETDLMLAMSKDVRVVVFRCGHVYHGECMKGAAAGSSAETVFTARVALTLICHEEFVYKALN